jgi:hypothetical protein
MSFASYLKRGKNYPTLTCDTCGQPIQDVTSAIITFKDLSGCPISHATGIYHKVTCDPGHEVQPYCDELQSYLCQLVFNLRLGRVVNKNSKQIIIDIPQDEL